MSNVVYMHPPRMMCQDCGNIDFYIYMNSGEIVCSNCDCVIADYTVTPITYH